MFYVQFPFLPRRSLEMSKEKRRKEILNPVNGDGNGPDLVLNRLSSLSAPSQVPFPAPHLTIPQLLQDSELSVRAAHYTNIAQHCFLTIAFNSCCSIWNLKGPSVWAKVKAMPTPIPMPIPIQSREWDAHFRFHFLWGLTLTLWVSVRLNSQTESRVHWNSKLNTNVYEEHVKEIWWAHCFEIEI
jgi:hypothetical protein